jgi:DNA-binding CsgD family transcriptional regulator
MIRPAADRDQCEIIHGRLSGKLLAPSRPRRTVRLFFGAQQPQPGPWRRSIFDSEAEVLLWIARGKSNRDIAEILELSPRTVNKHLEQIYAKLGVENRASAAALAVRTIGIR